MKSFIDTAGRTWVISINIASIKRLRGLLNVDLCGLIDDNLQPLGKLLADPVKLVDVLYCLCSDQADETGVSDEDFGRSMAGDAIEYAATAFLAELTDFFPDSQVRANLQKVLAMSRMVAERLRAEATQKLEGLDVDSIVKELIASSGNSPEASESTLGA